jgi:hypothetical protein
MNGFVPGGTATGADADAATFPNADAAGAAAPGAPVDELDAAT